jgi:hypothetical protein
MPVPTWPTNEAANSNAIANDKPLSCSTRRIPLVDADVRSVDFRLPTIVTMVPPASADSPRNRVLKPAS